MSEPLCSANVPSSFFSCIIELLARSLWWTEFLWGWCSPWSSSKSFSSMADEAFWSTASVVMLDDGCVYWVREGVEVVREEEEERGRSERRRRGQIQRQFIMVPTIGYPGSATCYDSLAQSCRARV